MSFFRAVSLFLLFFTTSPASAEDFRDGIVVHESSATNDLSSAISQELSELASRRAAVVSAYNELGQKLAIYHSWCHTYGITALRQLVEARFYGKVFSYATFPVTHVYSNDPYFAQSRQQLDEVFDKLRTTSVDVGRCALTEEMVAKIQKDPKHFDPEQVEFAGASLPYAMLAGNIRLIEEERQILLELRGLLKGSGGRDKDAAVLEFVSQGFRRLQDRTTEMRARTLEGYELGFRVPFGPLEEFWGKNVGQKETDEIPNFFYVFERRAFYVNQARLAAGKLFEVSVNNYTKAEAILQRFLAMTQEAGIR